MEQQLERSFLLTAGTQNWGKVVDTINAIHGWNYMNQSTEGSVSMEVIGELGENLTNFLKTTTNADDQTISDVVGPLAVGLMNTFTDYEGSIIYGEQPDFDDDECIECDCPECSAMNQLGIV